MPFIIENNICNLKRLIALEVEPLRWKVNRFKRAPGFGGRKTFLRPGYCTVQCSSERAIDPNLQVEIIATRRLKEKDSFEQKNLDI